MVAQRLDDLRAGDRPVVRANEDARDRRLHRPRLGLRKELRQRFQAFRVGDAMAGQRLQGPYLRLRPAHLRDARRQRAELADRGDRAMSQVRLCDARIGIGGPHQRLQSARVSLLASKACAEGGMRGVVGPRAILRVVVKAIELMLAVERAGKIDLGWAGSVARQQIAEKPHDLRPVLLRGQPSEIARQPQHMRTKCCGVGVAGVREIARAGRLVVPDRCQCFGDVAILTVPIIECCDVALDPSP